MHIRKPKYNFIKKSSKLLIFKNNTKMDKLPMNAPNIILKIVTFLFKMMLVVINNMKSKKKFKNNNPSTYIVIPFTNMSIKKTL